ncbi:hypothetical protein BJ944DRAFT_266024 [Cunninghamella echinulata]|nr:hypothetical protein BJ944DRAFT_266024 [Cunninghamella echinulata]
MLQENSKNWSIEQLFASLDHDQDGLIEANDLLAVFDKSPTSINEVISTIIYIIITVIIIT